MPAETTLSVPSIKVNNDVIPIVPNSFKYKSGDGETKVRAASVGGGNAQAVHSQDAETMFSTASFRVYPTLSVISLIRDWKSQTAGNTIDALQRDQTGAGKDLAIAFMEMSVTNDPDVEAGADTDIEIMFAGTKLA